MCPLIFSGLSHESHRRDVEQVYLRCSQGTMEWLYPTGAIIVNLRPNTEASPGHMAGLHVCIKTRTYSQVKYDTGVKKVALGRQSCVNQHRIMMADGWCSYVSSWCSVFRVLTCIWSVPVI